MNNITLRLTKYAYFMDIALTVSKRSPCLSRQVGCILVDEHGHIVATGYNGPPRGVPHCASCQRSEAGRDLYQCKAVHAEMNALLQCNDVERVKYIFVNINPCAICLRLLMNTSIKYILCADVYTQESAEKSKLIWTGNDRLISFGAVEGDRIMRLK